MLDYVSRNYEFRCGLRMINIKPDHYSWLPLRVGIGVSWWLTVAKINTGKFGIASCPFAGSAPSATSRRCASSARIDPLRNLWGVYAHFG